MFNRYKYIFSNSALNTGSDWILFRLIPSLWNFARYIENQLKSYISRTIYPSFHKLVPLDASWQPDDFQCSFDIKILLSSWKTLKMYVIWLTTCLIAISIYFLAQLWERDQFEYFLDLYRHFGILATILKISLNLVSREALIWSSWNWWLAMW